jgi:hypothetical protein
MDELMQRINWLESEVRSLRDKVSWLDKAVVLTQHLINVLLEAGGFKQRIDV